jgi:hypothetical protein
MYMTTPKRLKHNFSTLEGAEIFASQKKKSGAKDVVVTELVDIRNTVIISNGADVAWTEYTTD